MFKKILLASLLASVTNQAVADEGIDNQFGITGGLTFGGDKLGGLQYEGGGSEEVSAGGLFALGVALRTQYSENIISKFTANYHFDTVTASNADVSFSRFTVDALAGYKANENINLYAGITYHLSPEFSSEFDGSATNKASFDDSLGFVIEAAYVTDANNEFSLRYVPIEYDMTKVNQFTVSGAEATDGSHIGIYFTAFFE